MRCLRFAVAIVMIAAVFTVVPRAEALPVPGEVSFVSGSSAAPEGTSTHSVAVELTVGSGNTLESGFTVDIEVSAGSPGTATQGTDYTYIDPPRSHTVTYSAGDSDLTIPKTITIDIVPDSLGDPGETINLELTNLVGSSSIGAASTHQITIADDDSLPVLSIADAPSVTEGAAAVFPVNLSTAAGQDVVVGYSTSDGSATGGSDYETASSSLTISEGSTSGSITVNTIGDSIAEGPESFTVTLSAPPNTAPGTLTGSALITDNDTPGVLIAESGGSTDVTEGGATDSYTVVLTSQPTANVNVTVSGDTQVTGSALAAFTASNWSTPKPVTVSADPDSLVEGVHSGTISHTASSGDGNYSGIAIASVTATITDNDFSVDFAQGSSSPTEGDSGSAPVTIDVELETNGQNLGSAASVQVVRTGGSATGADYTFTSPSPVTFPANSPDGTTRSVTLNVTGDTIDEPFETVVLGLQNVSANGAIVGQTSHTLNILDNDGAPGLAVIDAIPVAEGGPAMSFTISLLPASGQTVRVNYATADGTAKSVSDYSAVTGFVEFTPGQTTKTVTVPVTNDTTDEITETVLLNLTSPVNAEIPDDQDQATGSILDNDNADPTVELFQTLDTSNNPMFQFGTGDTVKIRVNFTDAGVADSHTVTVNWGDGSAPLTFPITAAGPRSFERNHAYATEGFYQISASIADGDGGSAADDRFVTVSGAGTADGDDTVALIDPTRGLWRLYNDAGVAVHEFYYGVPGDYPFMGDWDGDGIETPGLYRQADGYVYLRNSNTQGIADIKFFFGNPGDVPIAGDFNNDGFDTVSIYRPSNQRFYIINKLGSNDGGLGAAEVDYVFGNPGDKPFVGDFDGDGIETVGLHRESTGLVYFRNSHTQGNADNQFIFGDPGDQLVAGDWTLDGIDTPALYRSSDTVFYFRNTNTQGNADTAFTTYVSGWIPVSGETGA